MTLCREVNEEFLEFECHLKLDVHILRCTGIPYKYCVYGNDHTDDHFEYLYGVPRRGWIRDITWNRCLRVNYKPGKGKNYMNLLSIK